ncbi:hypothetical protein X975_00101, partial [Stegodyphus mimosarum]
MSPCEIFDNNGKQQSSAARKMWSLVTYLCIKELWKDIISKCTDHHGIGSISYQTATAQFIL